jgi:hypothetical protein
MTIPAATTASFAWLVRHKEQIARIGAGHICYGVFNWLYDNILYVFIVYRLGLLVGGGLMTVGSLLQCAALLLAYKRMKIDWVGTGALHSLAQKERPTFIEKILLWAMRKGKVPIFLALCVYQDPFITTAYFTEGRFEKLTSRDWKTFFASVFVSNGYWTLRSGLVAQVIVHAWRSLHFGT